MNTERCEEQPKMKLGIIAPEDDAFAAYALMQLGIGYPPPARFEVES